MNMFLLGCVALFLLVLITALVKAKSPGGQATRRNGNQNKASTLGNNPLDEVGVTHEAQEAEALAASSELGLKPAESEKEGEAKPANVEIDMPTEPRVQYVVFHVMAPAQKEFGGYELLQALLSNGLRYNKQRIFNYHQAKRSQSEVLFSLASVNKPGTFDLPKMSEYSCPGLTLFMVTKELSSPVEAFEAMLKVAKQLADDLEGDVYTENHQALTQDYVKKLHATLSEYSKPAKTADLFE